MMRFIHVGLAGAMWVMAGAASAETPEQGFETLKTLAGEWVDEDGSLGEKGKVVVSYRVTAGGSAVVETLFPGDAHEMVSVYTMEKGAVVMSHYCAMGNQPRMRASSFDGQRLNFAFDGGLNFDPAKDMHMHQGYVEFLGPNQVHTEWQTYQGGQPGEHIARFHLARKQG
ncbi:MAG: hypothetical protein U1F26_01370 [Lysobacterales bacterium]